ncbi:MAG: ABC transporter permease [Anaerolineales bacterium]|nr:ABC transporter permease [Anaerolineales bacterium]
MPFNTRGRKILRDIAARKARTALVSTSIFIGVLGVVMMFSMGELFIRQIERTIDVDTLSMVYTYVSLNSDDVDNEAVLETLRAIPDIEHVQGQAIYAIQWKVDAQDEDFLKANLFSYSDPLDELKIEPLILHKGRYPTVGQHEIAVDRRLADKYDLELSDTITLRVLSGDAPHEETWTIVGTLLMPYQYSLEAGTPNYIQGETVIVAALPDAQYIGNFKGFTMFQARYADFPMAQAEYTDYIAVMTGQTPYRSLAAIVTDPEDTPFIQQFYSFRDVLRMLSIVSLVVSGALVFNIVNATVVEQRRQIGTMKSLGATGLDHFFMYAGISLVYGIIGVIPGTLLGVPLGYWSTKNIAPQFNAFIDTFEVSWLAVIIGVMLGLIVPVMASILPVLLGTRVSIVEAITDLGIDTNYNTGPLSRLVKALPIPISIRQAFNNVLKKKGRLALTMITLSLAAGAFMGIYAVFSTFEEAIANIYGTFANDITISPTSAQDFDTIRQLVLTVDGVREVEPGARISIDIDGYTPTAVGAAPPIILTVGFNTHNPNLMDFNFTSGTGWSKDPDREGIVISSTIAANLDKKAGDSLIIHAGNKTESFEIIGVTNYPFDTIWFRWQSLALLGDLTQNAPTPNTYQSLVRIDDQPVGALGVDNLAASVLTFSAGEFLNPTQNQIIVTEAYAEQSGHTVGDTVTLTSGNNSADFQIVGVFSVPPQFQQPNQPDSFIALNWQQLAALEGISLEGDPVPNALAVLIDNPDATADEVDVIIDDINEVLLANGINANYINWEFSAQSTSELIGTAGLIMNTAAFLIALVGAIGLLTTLSMSVFERQKEIGVMRSIGATSIAVALQFLVEGIIVGLIAWGVGSPLSFVLNDALMVSFNFGDMGTEYPLVTLLIGFVGVLGLTIVSSLWPSLSAARKTVSDILRYQ